MKTTETANRVIAVLLCVVAVALLPVLALMVSGAGHGNMIAALALCPLGTITLLIAAYLVKR